MYWLLLSKIMLACQALGIATLVASLWKSKTNYWISTIGYTAICLLLFYVFFVGFVPALGIGYAFGGRSIPFMAFIPAIIIFLYLLAPAASLFPFLTNTQAKWIGIVCFAMVSPLIVLFAIFASGGGFRGDNIRVPYATELLFLTLLWLRCYELKKSFYSYGVQSLFPADSPQNKNV